MLIKQLSDIVFTTTPTIITFDGTVIEIQSEGDGEKRPYKFVVKLEESGENLSVSSWKFDNLETIKNLVDSDEVYRFEGSAAVFGNFGEQVRIGNIQTTGLHSNKKVIRKKQNINDLKRETQTLINTYIKTENLKNILNKLVLEKEDFFKWPAATKVHHNYEGGLAVHSLSVAKTAISFWKNYNGENLDIEVIVAGALLHDIGKLQEYKIDGTRTIYGNLIPHPVSGAELFIKTARELGVDPDSDIKLLMIHHIILSHHGKLEFGASVVPYISEAWIVSNADDMDSKVEAINAALINTQKFQATDKLIACDGGRILKWKE